MCIYYRGIYIFIYLCIIVYICIKEINKLGYRDDCIFWGKVISFYFCLFDFNF